MVFELTVPQLILACISLGLLGACADRAYLRLRARLLSRYRMRQLVWSIRQIEDTNDRRRFFRIFAEVSDAHEMASALNSLEEYLKQQWGVEDDAATESRDEQRDPNPS